MAVAYGSNTAAYIAAISSGNMAAIYGGYSGHRAAAEGGRKQIFKKSYYYVVKGVGAKKVKKSG